MTPRRRTTDVVVAVGVAADLGLLAGALLPWHQSGTVHRNAFALAKVADDIGLVDTTQRRVLLVAVLLLPLVGGLAFLAATLGRLRVSGVCTAVAGTIGLTSTAVASRLAGSRLIGPAVTAAAGIVAVGCGVRLVYRGDRGRD
jgi:hypothetical protein